MVFKWQDGYVERFLDLYREHECLWNVNSELYKNKIARDIAYQEICESMNLEGLTVSDVKNKIKIIRTNYKSELNKIVHSELSGSPLHIYTPRMFWFKKADEFLRSVSEGKVKISKLHFRDFDHHSTDVMPGRVEESMESAENSNLITENVPKHSKTKSITRVKRGTKRSSKISSIGGSFRTLQKMFKLCREDEDEFELFGRSIAIQLKKMPLERALICQEGIQAVVRQERLYQLSRHFSTNSERSSTSTTAAYRYDSNSL